MRVFDLQTTILLSLCGQHLKGARRAFLKQERKDILKSPDGLKIPLKQMKMTVFPLQQMNIIAESY